MTAVGSDGATPTRRPTQTRALRYVDARAAAVPTLGGGALDSAATGAGAGMRVYQAGSHLLQERGVRVRDWSWQQTRRRFSTLGRLVAPYRGRAILSVLTLLLATAIALAPPFLAKFALDDAINGGGGSST